MRTHNVDRKGNPVKKDETNVDRKQNKRMRIHRLFGLAYEDTKYGKTVYYWDKNNGPKKYPEHEAEIFRNLRDAELERSAYAELMPEKEHRIGYNAVERIMYNADKRMREIRAEMAEKNHGYDDGKFVVETYDDSYVVRCGDGGFQYAYPDEYYNEKATWEGYEYMIRKYGMEYANKYAKGECEI